MIAIIDYGIGNVFSVRRSLEYLGLPCILTGDPAKIRSADRLILPGVGAFRDAILRLRKTELDKVVIERANAGIPLLGVCLGMQLLFDKSLEYGEYEGLSLIPGVIASLRPVVPPALKVPQIGWNSLRILRSSPLLRYTMQDDYVYFVHSYYATQCDEAVIADTDYGTPVPAIVQRGNVMGCQFHPEKSGKAGLSILRAFSEVKA